MRHAQPSCQTRCMDSKRETAGRQVTQPEDEHPTSADPTDGKTKKTRIQNTRPQSHPPVWTNQTAILPCKCGTPFHRSFEPSFITTLRLQCLNMDQHYAEFGVGCCLLDASEMVNQRTSTDQMERFTVFCNIFEPWQS